jgi:hypothetical protein
VVGGGAAVTPPCTASLLEAIRKHGLAKKQIY